MSKKDSTFAAKNKPQIRMITQETYCPVYEVTSSVPCDALVHNEAMSIREMLERTSRGQRLNVHTRMRADGLPDNMYRQEFDAEGNPVKDKDGETFAHTPPDGVVDIVDVQRVSEELAARRAAMNDRKKKSVANASASAPATQTPTDNVEVPPAAEDERREAE